MFDEITLTKKILKESLKNKNNKMVLYKWLKSELAYTSNAIEGNTLTKKETELVIEEHLTSSAKPFVYYQEAVNHAKAFERVVQIVKEDLPINENEILNIHKIILNGIDDINAGFYRDCMVRISGSRVVLPNPVKVPLLMTDFCKWLSTQDMTNPVTAILAHLKFVSIHPFVDGNGRCARLLMNLILLKAGYAPIIIRKTDRKRYLDAIEKAQLSADDTAYVKYMEKILLRSMKTVVDLLDTSKEDVSQNDLLTIAKFAKFVNLPVSTIRYWVQQNKLKPYSYTASGYMIFSKQQKEDIKNLKG